MEIEVITIKNKQCLTILFSVFNFFEILKALENNRT